MKNKFLLFLSCYFFSTFILLGQTNSIQGKIQNNENQPVIGAHVALEQLWGEAVKSTITDEDGFFELEKIPTGGYKLKISFLGLKDIRREVTINGTDVNLETIKMEEELTELGEIVVKEKAPIAQQLGDTTQYNASSFKTLPDADADELVQKMPGVMIQDGKIQAQGEDVKQVLVDGKPFFGNDPMAALKNLPAEVIDKIQVFDQQSDQSQFTGFNDGETTKTMNIITRPNMRSGQFGKIYAGYGYEDKYKSGGNFSIFNDDQRISIIAQSNNINIQNFSSEDLLGVVGSSGRRGRGRGGSRGGGGGRGGSRGGGGSVNDFLVGQQSGIAQTHAFGINYSDEWGEKLKASGSYFFNLTDNDAVENLNREFVDTEELSETYSESSSSNTKNFNHRLNFRLDYTLDSLNSITMRPRLSWQNNDGTDNTFGQTFLDDFLLNQTDNDYFSNLKGINFSNSILWRHRFSKPRRTISFNVGMGYNNKFGESFLESEDNYFDSPPTIDTLNQFTDLNNDGWNISSRINFTEPIGKRSQLMLEYRSSYAENKSEQEAFDFSEATQAFDDPNVPLSSIFTNNTITNSIGTGYNYRKDAWMVMARARFQRTTISADETFPIENSLSNSYNNIIPMLMIRYRKSRQDNYMLMYRSNTENPQASQLQNVLDNSNPVQLSIGNPNLKQAVQHRVFGRYQKTNTAKSSALFLMLSVSTTKDYIGNSTYLRETDNPIFDDIQLESGSQLSIPVNLDNYYNVRSFFSYGIPVKLIKSNLNFDLSYTFSNTPGLINDVLNTAKSSTYGVGVVLASNISRTVDFTISTRTNMSDVTNSIPTNLNSDFINQNSRAKLGWILPKGIVFRTDLNHQLYNGLSDDEFDTNYWLWNVAIGKKLFKNQLGEVSLSVFDILGQNTNINRNITDVYIEDVQTQVLQRFVMLNFTYNFRNFNVGKKPMPDLEEQRNRDRDRGGWRGRN